VCQIVGRSAQDSGDLAVAPDERNLHALDAMTPLPIADAPHPHAERTLHSQRDAGAVHEYDDILQRRAFDRAGE
jgi:hypothetical protein